MNIYEAAKVNQSCGTGLFRSNDDPFWATGCIIPTNVIGMGCIVSNGRRETAPRWQPSLYDLIAEDWHVRRVEPCSELRRTVFQKNGKMTICEAARLAHETSAGMFRMQDGLWERMTILPTNTAALCIAISKLSSNVGRRWEPNLDDLLAEDWAVRDYGDMREAQSKKMSEETGNQLNN